MFYLLKEHLLEIADTYVKFDTELIYSDEAATDLHRLFVSIDRDAWRGIAAKVKELGYPRREGAVSGRVDFLDDLVDRFSGANFIDFFLHMTSGLRNIGLEVSYEAINLKVSAKKARDDMAQLDMEPDDFDEDEITQDVYLEEATGIRKPEEYPLSTELLRGLIRLNEELGKRAAIIEPLIAPSVGLVPAKTKGPPGGAQLFGNPELPAGVDWPKKKGRRLPFVLQVPLAPIHRICGGAPLPQQGMLFVFADERDMSVIHSTGVPLKSRERGRTAGVPVELVARLSIPSPWLGTINRLELDDAERRSYEKVWRRVERSGRSYFLGHLAPHQEDPLVDQPWLTFLFQVELEEVFEDSSGTSSCIYAAAPAEAAAKGDFSGLYSWSDR